MASLLDDWSPHDFIDETVSDKNGKFVIHGSANDAFGRIDPRLRLTNNASSNNSFPQVNMVSLIKEHSI